MMAISTTGLSEKAVSVAPDLSVACTCFLEFTGESHTCCEMIELDHQALLVLGPSQIIGCLREETGDAIHLLLSMTS